MILKTGIIKIHHINHINQMNQGSDNGWQSWKAATRNPEEALKYE